MLEIENPAFKRNFIQQLYAKYLQNYFYVKRQCSSSLNIFYAISTFGIKKELVSTLDPQIA